ncbi:Thioredoxin O1, mitochondrial [Ananas comosus]|uniref:Thioredoxin O1, mitochondrial n=1 Tax=Ananas comosus TaxID=4615 RepID=A0A199W9F6_ANACO|nr:Thioredoxin O1, mitochondrial [Ananas comosus]
MARRLPRLLLLHRHRHHLPETLTLTLTPPPPLSSSSPPPIPPPLRRIFTSSAASLLLPSRSFSAAPGGSGLVLVKSAEEFKDSMKKVQDEKFPAIFYFTAVWCPPCKYLSPVVEKMSGMYPHVTTYKVDIDQEGIDSVLGPLGISSVPTLHFFQNGQKASEIIGADVRQLETTMEKLYK